MKNFRNIIAFMAVMLILFGLSACSVAADNYISEQQDLISSYVKENDKMDPAVCSVFIKFENIDDYEMTSLETLKVADRLQDWLDLNSNLEVIGMVGPVEQSEVTGFYVVYKKSDTKFRYDVFLSQDNFAYSGYCASIFIDNTGDSTSSQDDYFYLGICKKGINTQQNKFENTALN